MSSEIEWFDREENSSSHLCANLASDTALIEGLVGARLGMSVQNGVTIITGSIVAFYYGWEMALFIIALSPLIGFGGLMDWLSMAGFGKKFYMKLKDANVMAGEAIQNIRTVRAFNAEERVLSSYRYLLEEPVKIGMKQAILSGIGVAFGEAFFFITLGLAFLFGKS